jgi:predicted transcriptional regulator
MAPPPSTGVAPGWQVNSQGSFVDGLKVSEVRLEDLGITESQYISVRIGVKESARQVGGLNIFGRHFGNYPQDIVLRLRYV